ncbi:hypothetical protein [Lysobacter fragariae]
MSDPNPGVAAGPRKGNGSRYLFLFLLGLVIGAVAVVMLLRTWEGRKTWRDNWPDAAMHVMDAHLSSVEENIKLNRCGATDTLPHIKSLRAMADDLEYAFPDLAEESRFKEHASSLRGKLDASLAAPPLNCPGAETLAKSVGEACKACHQDFR